VRALQAATLLLSHRTKLAATTGFEPVASTLTAWPSRPEKSMAIKWSQVLTLTWCPTPVLGTSTCPLLCQTPTGRAIYWRLHRDSNPTPTTSTVWLHPWCIGIDWRRELDSNQRVLSQSGYEPGEIDLYSIPPKWSVVRESNPCCTAWKASTSLDTTQYLRGRVLIKWRFQP
jgi:hypothetical protein